MTWSFDPFERLHDVPVAMAVEKMREFVALKDDIQRCRDDIANLHDNLLAARNFMEARVSLFKLWRQAQQSVCAFTDLTYVGTMPPVLPTVQLKNARDDVAAWLISINQVAKSWTDTSLLKIEDYKEALRRYHGLCHELLKQKPLLDAAAQACRQLRTVHPLGFVFMEAFSQTSPVVQPPLAMPVMLDMPPVEIFPSQITKPRPSNNSAEPPTKKLATSPQ